MAGADAPSFLVMRLLSPPRSGEHEWLATSRSRKSAPAATRLISRTEQRTHCQRRERRSWTTSKEKWSDHWYTRRQSISLRQTRMPSAIDSVREFVRRAVAEGRLVRG